MRAARKFERLGRGRLGATSLLAWIRELFRYYYALGARGNLLRAPPPPAREEPPAAPDPDETVADSSAEADAAYIAGQSPSREGSRPVTPPPLSPIAEEPPPIPTATPATDALAAESISLVAEERNDAAGSTSVCSQGRGDAVDRTCLSVRQGTARWVGHALRFNKGRHALVDLATRAE